MKVLITGGTGFVGRPLSTYLVSRGHEVVVSVRDRRRFEQVVRCTDPGLDAVFPIEVASLSASTDWTKALAGIDVVIHCAARVHVMNEVSESPANLYFETNVAGTEALADQAAKAGVKRFIFISSIKVNGESTGLDQPFTADDEPAPIDPYGISKRDAEKLLLNLANETEMEVVIIRPPLIYGPGVKANFETLIRSISRGTPLPLGAATHNRRSLLALGNLIDLIHICLDHPGAMNQIFLASDGEDLSTAELARRIGLALGKKARLIYVPRWLVKLGATVLNRPGIYGRLFGSLRVDISKNKRLLGWVPPVSIDSGLRDTTQAFNQPPL